ncbi:hypothetical protein OG883_17725 [Streptomyces sp. NBC_01142]|uniref:uridine kinase family protein n=1 Tax=Streptomyces sp. NBC_01142 TaxID=2975865 RepID=UPI002256F3B7|nr:hypothetical protein [Streptomyces sp. NBC_01142]MCX4821692.1 hypothetical protein [Streptomyces sp. NBC_01142]
MDDDLCRQAAALRALAPSCGPVRLVAVDGHAGSGKSTFAARLAAALGHADANAATATDAATDAASDADGADGGGGDSGVPVLHLDDLATHEELFAWTDRLLAQVIEPLSRGEVAHYNPYDWNLRRFGPPRLLAPSPVVLIEGVGAGRRALRPHLARLLWMERDAGESWARGRCRDGSELSAFWDGWTVAETRHFSADPSRPYADALVREWQEGYEWLPGPPATARPNQIITYSDGATPPY